MTAIWLTWEIQRRNRSLAAAVGATLHELHCPGGRLKRYLSQIPRTFRLVRKVRPDVIYYQNPSLILAALLTTLKALRLTRARLIGDFHNAGVHPPAARWLVPWIVRHSDLVIVSNSNLEPQIQAMGGRTLSLPDPIPHFEVEAPSREDGGAFDVLFICSWASDEPIVEVLKAAQVIAREQPGIVVSITGRPKLEKVGWLEAVPANVRLTGFLSEHDFERRVLGAQVVLDLTTRADCMVCGAYEAVSAGVPMVLSDNPPTRAYFRKGALFTDNSAASIAAEILRAHGSHAAMSAEVAGLKQELLREEQAKLKELAAFAAAQA
jgi:glycosyltransferase involved in cell wall biosynthesis